MCGRGYHLQSSMWEKTVSLARSRAAPAQPSTATRAAALQNFARLLHTLLSGFTQVQPCLCHAGLCTEARLYEQQVHIVLLPPSDISGQLLE